MGMREILFWGKREDNGEWVYGMPCATEQSGIYALQTLQGGIFDVIPETVGQYTGQTDKTCEKIFEGNLVNISEHNPAVNGRYLVIYGTTNHCWALERSVEHHHHYFTFSDLNGFAESSEVIGNIYDNPDLLGERWNDERTIL